MTKPSDNEPSQRQVERDALSRLKPSDLLEFLLEEVGPPDELTLTLNVA